jgi:soluble lytic murein transglycosylase
MVAESPIMKRWLASLLVLAACAPEATPLPVPSGPSTAAAAAIPEGRTPEERREIFHAAVTLFERGNREGSEPLFTRVAAVYPELADYALRYLAKIAELRGDTTRGLSYWQALREQYPESVWVGEADLAVARGVAASGDWNAAEREADAARNALAPGPARAEAIGIAREAARRRGDVADARMLGVELRTRYAGSPEALAAREDAWAERETVALASPSAAHEEAGLLLSEGDSAHALELVRLAQARYRSDDDAPELLWLEASALAKMDEKDAAAAVLDRLRDRYPRHPAAAKALYRQASAAWNRDEDETALALFARYVVHYPRGEQAADATYAIARIHQEARRFDAAARQFARLVRSYPKSSLASEARFRVGWCYYRAGERARAAQAFQQIAELGTDERPAALYWKGRSLDDVSAYASVLAAYPESYYATLAEQRLSRPTGSSLAERVAGAGGTSGPVAACGGGDPHLARFDEFRAIGLAGFARSELAAYADRVSGCDAFFITSWEAVYGYRQAVGRAQRASGCGLASPWIRYCYPLGYWPTVERETAARSLDPYLVASLIRQESLFDAEVRSAANAIGLMQILPATASALAARHGLGDFDASQLLDPATNVTLGTAYLRELLDRYSGNLPRALAAYNAGEAAVDKWQRRYPDLEDDEFVESISYRETRGYVKRVLANRRMYGALYSTRSALPTTPAS